MWLPGDSLCSPSQRNEAHLLFSWPQIWYQVIVYFRNLMYVFWNAGTLETGTVYEVTHTHTHTRTHKNVPTTADEDSGAILECKCYMCSSRFQTLMTVPKAGGHLLHGPPQLQMSNILWSFLPAFPHYSLSLQRNCHYGTCSFIRSCVTSLPSPSDFPFPLFIPPLFFWCLWSLFS